MQIIELLMHMTFKNVRVQYRKPLLGFLWAFIVPFCMALIFKVVFSLLLRISVAPYPFFVYLLTAIFPWGFSQIALLSATTSLVDNKHIVRESRFPREIIPFSVILAHLIAFLPSIIVILMLIIYLKLFTFWIILLPGVVIVHVLLIAGISLVTSMMHVRMRDTRFSLEVILNGLFYLTPVFYPLDLVARYFDGFLLRIYMLNPFVGLITWYRICFLKGFSETIPAGCEIYIITVPIVVACIALASGIVIFRRQEKNIVDYLEV
ncbi:ABC transporter permease [Candidatus Omnitrophota bacterium]